MPSSLVKSNPTSIFKKFEFGSLLFQCSLKSQKKNNFKLCLWKDNFNYCLSSFVLFLMLGMISILFWFFYLQWRISLTRIKSKPNKFQFYNSFWDFFQTFVIRLRPQSNWTWVKSLLCLKSIGSGGLLGFVAFSIRSNRIIKKKLKKMPKRIKKSKFVRPNRTEPNSRFILSS